ncbi:exodeoxyribonuclease VII large subunit [Thalassotalea sp. PLHSN55]|uniref:exodeoxyribonuclease VII large subunit n=1 Tax=Thalassotalea sp. PLHSN55 TaxID=3435888 RepID=UPI003F84565E
MSQQHILQVSELTKKVRFILESELNTVWLCGEISNFIAASSGHWYLSLKDSKSQVRCAMFKGNNRRVRISPRNGQQVLVRARVSLYEPRGDFQLIIEQMEDAGEGLLRQQYDQLKQKLNAQGLFGQAHKQILPKHIKTVGIVTSPTGAAVKDILSVLKRRNPTIKAIIYPSLVQGEAATADIVAAIRLANERNECDVLIVGRGGGSLEDLWCFNEESVVNAIYQSQLPIISAVGHEIDTTLSDYVADVRAATPSAAAELVSDEVTELSDKIAHLTKRLLVNQQQVAQLSRQRYLALAHRLSQVHPEQKLQVQQQKADELENRLQYAIKRELQRFTIKPTQLKARLTLCSPEKSLADKNKQLKQLTQRLEHNAQQLVSQKQQDFAHLVEQLHMVSPLATIARGYSIARDANHTIIKSTKQVTEGDELTLQLHQGSLKTKVISKQN